jgi:glycosyltransferase involved in cell wall biosynthesis
VLLMAASRVDVIVPCYNYARFLRRSVASILTQAGVRVRVLIIDDASSDDTPDVGRALAREDSRVEFRRHTSNRGHITTYNEGIEWLTADYALLLSADDGLTPGALRRATRIMDAHPDVGLTYGQQIAAFDAEWPEVADVGDRAYRVLSGADFLDMTCASGQNAVPTPSAVVRTSLQLAIGGYRKELPHTGDLEVWLRLAARAGVAVIDAVQAVKRFHGRNMQLDYLQDPLGDLAERLAAFETFFGEHPGLTNRDRLRATVMRRLASEAFWAASGAFDRCDTATCDRLLAWARTVDPDCVRRPEWSRLKWKRRCGPLVWSALRPAVNRVRATLVPHDAAPVPSR